MAPFHGPVPRTGPVCLLRVVHIYDDETGSQRIYASFAAASSAAVSSSCSARRTPRSGRAGPRGAGVASRRRGSRESHGHGASSRRRSPRFVAWAIECGSRSASSGRSRNTISWLRRITLIGARVEGGGVLIEQQQFRFHPRRHQQRERLALASVTGCRSDCPGRSSRPMLSQRDAIAQLVRARPAAPSPAARLAGAALRARGSRRSSHGRRRAARGFWKNASTEPPPGGARATP